MASPSPPLGAERVGVRWGIPGRRPPTSPSHACGVGPFLSPLVWTGEIVDGCSGTWLTHPIGIFGLLGRGWDAVVGEVDHVAAA
jgi:hypothetical protein